MKKITAKALKADARKLLQHNYGFFAMVTLLLTVMNLFTSSLVSGLFSSGSGLWSLILQIAFTLVLDIFYYLLVAGLIRIYMKLCTGHHFSLKDLTFAFSHQPEQIAIYAVVQFILQTIAVNVLLMYPIDLLTGYASINNIPYALAILAGTFLYAWIQFRITPALYLYNMDPWGSMPTHLKESWKLMRGSCLRLLRLKISFLGIELLCLLSFGVGYLFGEPYVQSSTALFCRELCGGFDYSFEEDENGTC